mgnify:CR=1 FL=1
MTEDFVKKIKNLQYKGIPVFGRDSNPQNTSEFIALSGTVLLWLILFLFFIFAKPFAKKQEFKTVQIVLSSTPVVKSEKKESAAAASAPAQKATSAEKQISKTEQPKQIKENPAPAKTASKQTDTPKKTVEKPAAKTAPAKQTPAKDSTPNKNTAAPAKQAPAAPVEYAKSVEELMAEQMSTPKASTKSFNWDDFSDDADDVATSTTQPRKISASSTTAGTSGKATTFSDTGLVSQAERDVSVNENASQNTTGALKGIKNAKYIGNAGSSHSSELTANVSNGSGKNQFAMTDGSSRGLLEPADPRIDLSEAAASQIDSTINVTIFIEVQPSGNVTSVDFNPSSIVPSLAQQEIRAQLIGKWRFERADYSSMGKFQYTIKKL